MDDGSDQRLTMLKIHQPAPDFRLPDASGTFHALSDFRGHTVVLYFYPKDMTSGCTDEACQFRDHHSEIQSLGAVILGISPDPPEKHKRFIEKHHLPFILLSDEKHQIAKVYQVWGKKKMYGKETEGIHRTTFIIDAEGRIRHIFEKVKVAGHAEEVFQKLKALS